MKINPINMNLNNKNSNTAFGCKYCGAIEAIVCEEKKLLPKSAVIRYLEKNFGDVIENKGILIGVGSAREGLLMQGRGTSSMGSSSHQEKASEFLKSLLKKSDKEIVDAFVK